MNLLGAEMAQRQSGGKSNRASSQHHAACGGKRPTEGAGRITNRVPSRRHRFGQRRLLHRQAIRQFDEVGRRDSHQFGKGP